MGRVRWVQWIGAVFAVTTFLLLIWTIPQNTTSVTGPSLGRLVAAFPLGCGFLWMYYTYLGMGSSNRTRSPARGSSEEGRAVLRGLSWVAFIKSSRGRLIPPASAVGLAARSLPCGNILSVVLYKYGLDASGACWSGCGGECGLA